MYIHTQTKNTHMSPAELLELVHKLIVCVCVCVCIYIYTYTQTKNTYISPAELLELVDKLIDHIPEPLVGEINRLHVVVIREDAVSVCVYVCVCVIREDAVMYACE